mgnify:CR=1 FL=1
MCQGYNSLEFSYDAGTDVLMVEGIDYRGDFFRLVAAGYDERLATDSNGAIDAPPGLQRQSDGGPVALAIRAGPGPTTATRGGNARMTAKPRPMVHELKCDAEAFAAVKRGRKPEELRKDDRDVQAGDYVLLREWVDGAYTGEMIFKSLVVMLLCLIAMRTFSPALTREQQDENGLWAAGLFFVGVAVASIYLGAAIFGELGT